MPRQKLKIDENLVFELAKLHCTNVEIARIVDCDPQTIENRFSDLVAKGKEEGKLSLRRAMFRSAVDNGNVAMMIWLSKNILGFTDKVEAVAIYDNRPPTFKDFKTSLKESGYIELVPDKKKDDKKSGKAA